ncbi:MAG: hypothetical protein CL529_12055 [Aequorivita sp.]|nr:hypothetical protein [Aequorivita sp.]|tara:strand:+ start:2785 stop:3015 length:231 start_codon:yes stop_codon:yes gene_type:complete
MDIIDDFSNNNEVKTHRLLSAMQKTANKRKKENHKLKMLLGEIGNQTDLKDFLVLIAKNAELVKGSIDYYRANKNG